MELEALQAVGPTGCVSLVMFHTTYSPRRLKSANKIPRFDGVELWLRSEKCKGSSSRLELETWQQARLRKPFPYYGQNANFINF